MKVAFDTSVLVPALVQSHSWHQQAIIWLEGVTQGSIVGVAGWHAMAESWSVLTRVPLKPRISSASARAMIAKLEDHLQLVRPSARIYRRALERCVRREVVSGAVFDALHLLTAEAVDAELLVTFNPRDFERLCIDSSPAIVVPPDPPSLDVELPADPHS